jgi:trehalose/maltose hydrolase-like predicted phosphorylase
MEHGVFYRRWYDPTQVCASPLRSEYLAHIRKGLAVEQRWYASLIERTLLVHEIELSRNSSSTTSLVCEIISTPGPNSSDIAFNEISSSPLVMFGHILASEETYSPLVQVAYASTPLPQQLTLESGETSTTFYFITALRTSLESSNPAEDALQDYEMANVMAPSLLKAHKQAWQQRLVGRVEIEGDLALAQAVNASWYALLASVRDDWPWSLSPGGLATNGYNGHTFWDCETWMYPTLLLLQPAIAQSLLEYRFNVKAGAGMKAQENGYQGMMFPWESAFTGEEVCPSVGGTCLYEIHINGDIAFAIAQYWWTTHDIEWLESTGYPLLYSICEFWESRTTQTGPDSFSIDNVIPPDEYHSGVNNSAYTNAVASFTFNITAQLGALLGITTPSLWSEIAEKLPIPFDPERQIHLEYDGYTNETIKQADVILLGYPLMYPMSEAVRLNDLNFYSNVTSLEGPAMTWGMTALG